MKRTPLTVLLLLSAIDLCAMDPTALTNAAVYIQKTGLESEHASFDVMSDAATGNGWTKQDCTDVLRLAYSLCRNSTNAYEKGCGQHAVSLLGEFGGTNALPVLSSIMQTGEGIDKMLAGQGYLRVAVSNPFPGWESPLREELARPSSSSGSFAWDIYNFASFELEYSGYSNRLQRTLLRFLLDQATVERNENIMLDAILCREVPKWRASPQRAENAAKMIREHPDDARLVAFFESVRTNALESARVAVPAERHDSAPTPVTTNLVSEAGLSAVPDGDNAASDPWADLLVDLPEKKPWVPPPGWEPPF